MNRNGKVMKKRRKSGGFSIEQNDDKNVVLDFFGEMEFNNHEGCESPKPSSSYMWMTDTGDLRKAEPKE